MAPIHERIRATAADNTRLLQTISDTDYAPSAVQQSNAYVANLTKELKSQEKLLADTQRTVLREHNEHLAFQKSHMKRMAYRIGGKGERFEEKASKEEKDWVEAVQREIECKRKLDLLRRNLAEATQNSADLEQAAATYNKAQNELDTLYKSIFEGPTPEIPGEDAREYALSQAAAAFDGALGHVNTEKRVQQLLVEANKAMITALREVEDARTNAKMDAFGFGGVFADMAEHNAISRVRQFAGQAEMMLSQARLLQPEVGDLGDIVHAQQNFMSDVLFDNVFSDMNRYDKIKKSQDSLLKAQGRLVLYGQACDERLKTANEIARNAKQVLELKRLELQQTRARAYEEVTTGKVIGDSPPDEAPPPYQS